MTIAAIYCPELAGPAEITGVRTAKARCSSEAGSRAMRAGAREDRGERGRPPRPVMELGDSLSLTTIPVLPVCSLASTEQGG